MKRQIDQLVQQQLEQPWIKEQIKQRCLVLLNQPSIQSNMARSVQQAVEQLIEQPRSKPFTPEQMMQIQQLFAQKAKLQIMQQVEEQTKQDIRTQIEKIEKLNNGLETNLFPFVNIPWLKNQEPSNIVSKDLTQRKILLEDGQCAITISPLAMSLILQNKATSSTKYEGILDTSFLVLKYPYLPEAEYYTDPLDYLSDIGGIFPEFKEFLKKKINLKKNFQDIIFLPDGHSSLLVYRTEEANNTLYLIDSVGKLMRCHKCLSNTIFKAFEESEVNSSSYTNTIYFSNWARQADKSSCAVVSMEDAMHITKYPELLKEIEVKALLDNNTENNSVSCKVFTQFPAHFMKSAQIIFLSNIQNMQDEPFKNKKGTLGEHFQKGEEVATPHQKHGPYRIYHKPDGWASDYLKKAEELVEKLGIDEACSFFATMYVDLYKQHNDELLGVVQSEDANA